MEIHTAGKARRIEVHVVTSGWFLFVDECGEFTTEYAVDNAILWELK